MMADTEPGAMGSSMMAVGMLKALIRNFVRSVDPPDKYRPERHYMRGPGPKSKERSERPDQVNNPQGLTNQGVTR